LIISITSKAHNDYTNREGLVGLTLHTA